MRCNFSTAFQIVVTCCGIIWGSLQSSWFLDPVALTMPEEIFQKGFKADLLDRPQATFVRKTRFGEHWAEWRQEMVSLGQGYSIDCTASGRNYYQHEEDDTTAFALHPDLLPCINSGAPFVLTQYWTVYLFGKIPLWWSVKRRYTFDGPRGEQTLSD